MSVLAVLQHRCGWWCVVFSCLVTGAYMHNLIKIDYLLYGFSKALQPSHSPPYQRHPPQRQMTHFPAKHPARWSKSIINQITSTCVFLGKYKPAVICVCVLWVSACWSTHSRPLNWIGMYDLHKYKRIKYIPIITNEIHLIRLYRAEAQRYWQMSN